MPGNEARISRLKQTLRTLAKRAGLTVLGTVALLGSYLGYLQLSGNFAPVIAGEVYRSAQPSPADIREYAARNGIRSIINLRGENVGKAWYDEEIAVSKELGITHINFGMSARRELDQNKVEELLATMRSAPKPILIHCKAGADRTGLASALYLAAVAKQGEQAAEGQISFYFGHISLPFIPEYAMDRTFEAMEPMLGLISN